MSMRIFFEYDGVVVQMPVNPQELEIKGSGSNKTKEIVSLGEINLLKPQKLKDITIKGFLPIDSSAPYVVTKGSFKEPEYYITFFSNIIKAKKPLLFIVTDTDIYLSMAIESFNHKRKYGTFDIEYEIKLKEFKNYSAKTVSVTLASNKANIVKTTSGGGASGATSQDITIGCTVRVNGRLHRDSYGSGPGVTEVNATRLVNFIKTGRSCPYHVTLLDGGWRGWVTADSVVRI